MKKKDFRLETISTVLETGLYASGGTFWGKLCSPRKNQLKIFFVLQPDFYLLLSNLFGMFIKIASLSPDERFEENFFFRTKTFSRVIFSNQAENCRTLHWIFNRKSKVPFKCLEDFFRETFVFGKNLNRSITCLRSWREFSSEIWEK